MTTTSLDDIFNTPAETKTEAPQKSEPAPQVAEPVQAEAVEPSQPVGTGDKNAGPPPADEEPSDVHGLRAALRAERQKRQESGTKLTDYEKRLAAREKELAERDAKVKEYEATVARFQQPPQVAQPQQQYQPQIPDPLLDPEGAFRFQEQAREREMFHLRTEISQEMFRSQRPDYDEVEKIFIDEAKKNPYLIEQLRKAPMPARFAYEEGQRAKLRREIGDDPAAYRAKLRKELEDELLSKTDVANPKTQTTVQAPPTSLAGVTSATPRDTRKVWNGPTPLEDILK